MEHGKHPMTKDKEIHCPHDRLFTATFKNKEAAGRFLEAYLPSKVVELMDLSQLEVDNNHFVDQALQQYRSDLLYQVPLTNGKPAYIYMLFEHQSTPDPNMPFRLLQYMVKIWEYTREKHKNQGLMPILPLVLSQSSWPYSPLFSQMMDLNEADHETLAPWIPDFQHLLVDLSTLDMDELQGNVYGKIVLYLLKSSRRGEIVKAYQALAPLLQSLQQQDNALGFIETLLRYSVQVAEDVATVEELRKLVVNSIDQTAGETLMTLAERIEQEVAAKYQQQLAEMAKQTELATKEKELVAREKELTLKREQTLLKQLRDAGIEPNIQH